MSFALTIARRELRTGIAGFRLFVACLALGVAAIAAVGSFAAAVVAGLDADARRLLGGDVEIRLIHRPMEPAIRAELEALGQVSEVAELRAMARAGEYRTLVELKAVDEAHPLVGAVETEPEGGMAALRDAGPGRGVLLDSSLLARLRLAVGDRVRIGEADFTVRGAIAREPDRGTSAITLGPPALVRMADLAATGLIQPGSLVAWRYRLALPDSVRAKAVAAQLEAAHPDAGWRIRTVDNAAPGLVSFIERLRLYLTLVGLTALLVGGVGIANAVEAFLERKQTTIAILKCLGAPGGTVLAAYFLQVAAMAAIGIAAGLVAGAGLPWLLAAAVGDQLPVEARIGIYPAPLASAAAFGLLTTLAFALWPLGRTRLIPAARLFRDSIQPQRVRPGPLLLGGTAAAAIGLAVLAVATAPERRLALWYVAGAVAALVIFHLAGWAVMRIARAAPRLRRPALRLAIANIHRPGSPAPSVVLSLGLGLTTLVAVALVQANMDRQVSEAMPAAAPTFFFIDIQADQAAAFDALVDAHPGVERHARVPSLRGRITRIGGVPIDQAKVAPEAEWALRNERGLTYAAQPPDGSEIVAGEWWPADYRGPPLISFDAEVAKGLGLGVGDTLTVNVLGREVTARIANLRRIRWTSLAINFTILFAPGTLEGAPQTHIATARVTPEQETALLTAVTDRFVNVSAIRVRDALDAVGGVLGQIAAATRATAAVTLAAGLLVLAGAFAAGHQRRVRDAVILKVLGATRHHVLVAYLAEYGLLGLATATIAAAFGTLAGWFILTGVMRAPWTFLPLPVLGTAAVAVLVTLAMGFAGTWRALGRKPAPILRNP
ncbi:putative ABC transport system permease protein [Stella humosa]|uniref:Putative ABC transport system permease protein n=1 Tax=Stella humosa TaxID=94 RepID=A0A3N1KNE7_9PROT|nr:FtsX-like permease family protein [Stella humosa]ROP83253.1 putative ABC transport system permease protein [Stella humosa]BBK29965.1 glycosyl transferase family 1 [Stella humosa]